jgi:serine/threonine protein phosphatase PrpC
VTNDGLLVRLHKDETVYIRGGDIISIGNFTFRVLSHNYGAFIEIGDKPHQEDRYCIADDLKVYDEISIPFYAVYDGHGGSSCSNYLHRYLHTNIREILKFKGEKLKSSNNFLQDFSEVIQEAIVYTDICYYETETNYSPFHGSTAFMIFFIGSKVLCCNLGDSLGILFTNEKKIYLSEDMKPTNERELIRIKKKNGFVTSNGRLLGQLTVSRSFGDWRMKDPAKMDLLKKIINNVHFEEYLISNRADFRVVDIDPELHEYMILVSDGIFQDANSKFIFDTINKYISREKVENSSIKNMLNVVDNVRLDIINNIYGESNMKGKSADNMTMILIHLKNNKYQI